MDYNCVIRAYLKDGMPGFVSIEIPFNNQIMSL